jgi:hypothetical protein
LAFLLAKNINLVGFDNSLYRLSENDILVAKHELQQAERSNQILRYGALIGAAGLAGLVLFKITPWVSDHLRQDRAQALVVGTGLIELEIKNQPVKINLERVAQCILAQAKAESSWGQWAKGLASATGMTLLPAIGSSLLQQKIGAIFAAQNINRLVFNLGIMNHFQRLKLAQIQFDPQAFATNLNHQNEPKLCVYAQQVAANFAKMPVDQVAELKAEAKTVWIEEANYIIKQMAHVIAYARYMVENNGTQSILNNCAEQLYLATDDFASKLELAFASGDTLALFDAVALLQSTFNITVNNVLIFSR